MIELLVAYEYLHPFTSLAPASPLAGFYRALLRYLLLLCISYILYFVCIIVNIFMWGVCQFCEIRLSSQNYNLTQPLCVCPLHIFVLCLFYPRWTNK